MGIERVGKRELNLAYLIMTEDIDDASLRVTMLTGKEFDLHGPEADRLRGLIRQTRETSEATRGECRPSPDRDPQTGQVLPENRAEGEAGA